MMERGVGRFWKGRGGLGGEKAGVGVWGLNGWVGGEIGGVGRVGVGLGKWGLRCCIPRCSP